MNITNELLYKSLIAEGLSTYQIAARLNIGQTTVRYWLKKFNLKTVPITKYGNLAKPTEKYKIGDIKICPKCGKHLEINKSNFYIRRNGKIHSWCRSCNDKITLDKQLKRKKQCVEYKGGKCCVCGYNKYLGALDFHHTNPSQKEFNISNLRTYSWPKLKVELDKCICVCRNCHAEIHGGLTGLGWPE